MRPGGRRAPIPGRGPRGDHPVRQRRGTDVGRRTPPAAGPPPARRPGAHRHERRVRHLVVRGVHRPAGRRVGEVVHDPRGPGRRARGDDDRGPGRRRRQRRDRCPPPGAGGLRRPARAPVRLLHPGHGHGGGVAARREPAPHRGGRAARSRGQPVPLHRLPEHRASGARRRGGGAGMTATETPTTAEGRAFGQRLLRKEDPRLLTGEARFIDDLQIPGALWMGMVRSPYAHARIRGIDVSAALEMPGVRHVFTGADLADAWADPMPCAWPVTEDMKAPAHWPVAKDKACYVGDIVAVVVAEDRYQAADAVDAVVVDYEPLEAVVDIEDAASDRVVVHEELGTNRSYTWTLSPEPEAVERAFAEAAHTVSETYVQQRLIPVAMEPRGVA